MKFFQFNINSIITSLDELRKYQNKNNYDGIFLRETNYTDSKPLDNFKYWKSEMHAIKKSKYVGFGFGALIPISMFFRCDYIKNDLGIIWNQMNIQNKDVLIGNIYVAPGDENQLKILEKELERRRGKT